MKVFITYPNRKGYDSALQTLADAWEGRWKQADISAVVRVIEIFAPSKVVL